MTNQEISKIFSDISKIMALHGENTFKGNAYETAAEIIKHSILSPEDFVKKAKAGEIKGIGKQLASDLEELLDKGEISHVEAIKNHYPSSLFELFEISGLGPKKIRLLYDSLKVSCVEDLEKLCIENKLAAVKGYGEKSQEKIYQAILHFKENYGKLLYKRALYFATDLRDYIIHKAICKKIEISGQLRRLKPIIEELCFVVLGSEKNFLKELEHISLIDNLKDNGSFISGIHSRAKINLKFFLATEENFNTVFFTTTSSESHLQELGTSDFSISSEEKFYKDQNLAYIPPECREGNGAVSEAKETLKKGLPALELIENHDIKGIIHSHSTYSDGHNTLEELASYVKAQGYQYLGISDHSQSAAYAGGLKIEKIKMQHQEIDFLNEKLKPFHIFKGIESDILADGSLDYSDDILALFDFVIVSIHSKFEISESEMTQRMIKAIANPYTTILAHPSGRLLLKRREYLLNYQEVLKAAAQNKVIVEINANPRRLDLDWQYYQTAKELGVYFSINPDAHSLADVSNIQFGINMARKGRLKIEDVLTTLNLAEITKYFENAKRRQK